MKTMLRILTVLLLCMILCCCLSVAASAETVADGACGDALIWTLDDAGTLTISGTGTMTNYGQGTAPWYGNRLSISSVVIGNGVTSIGNYAFYYCIKMTNLVIPGSLKTIGSYAFNGCSKLTGVTIPDSVTSFGSYAFSGCSSLTSVTIPGSVTSIGNIFNAGHVFSNCSSLSSVTIENGVESIGDYAFSGCNSLTSVTIPNSVTSIGSSVFSGCSGLTSVMIPNSVTGISSSAFFGCSSLTSVTIPNSVTSIGSSAFCECSSLTSVTIPNSVTSIGYDAFYRCSSLTSVTIPNSVTSIGNSAFSGCNLTEVTIPDGVVSIGNGAFSSCNNLVSAHISAGVTSIGSNAFLDCGNLMEIRVDEDNPNYCDMDGVLFDKNAATLLHFPRGWVGDYEIPDSVTDTGSFSSSYGLTSIKIPGSVTSIGENAFQNCSSLATVTILNDVTSIGYRAFYDCNSLTSITIPSSMTTIGDYAFSNCSSLAVVYYGGTESQWNAIMIGNGNRQLLNALRFYNGETPAVCTISFDPNGSSGEMSPMTVEVGKAVKLGPCDYWLQNYIFIGWEDQNGTRYADEGTLTPTGDLTLRALWRRTAYSIRYEPNGGGGNMYTQSVSVNSSASVRENQFNAPPGEIFAVWMDGSGTPYVPGSTITPTYDMTLYAQWRDSATIWYYPGTASGTTTSRDIPLDYPVKLPKPADLGFTANDGETFAGWLIEGDDTLHKSGEEVIFDSEKNVTAQWMKSIKISFNPNGGSYSSRKAMLIPQDTPTTLAKMTSIGYTRSGYAFAGWGLTPNVSPDSAALIPDGGTISFSFDTELYAIWRQKAFVGTVELIGDESGHEDRAYFGETLTAEINGESLFTVFTYQWLRDGAVIPDATKVSYVVGEIDFGHSLSCAVTAIEAPENATKTSYMKLVGIDVEEKQLVDNGLTEFDAIRGLTPDMTYSIDGGAKQSVSLDSQGRMPVTQQGIYQFYKNGALVGTVKVVNWFSLRYSVNNSASSSASSSSSSSSHSSSSSSSSSSGAGAVLMRYGNQQLTASTRITDTNGNVIIKGNGTISWLVRDGANLTNDITMTIKPSSISYAHVSLNDDDYSSLGNGESTITVSPVMGPMRYKIVFSTDPVYPPLPAAVIDEATFPDPAFRRYVLANIDRDGDGVLYSDEINRTIVISCSNYGISSLKGIEVFTNLINLSCQSNNLTELDLSGCPHLTTLYCADNSLTALDVSTCPVLSSLNCSNNVLSSLNVSNCPGLTTLDCSGNLLAALDLSGNPQLRSLDCYDNLIHSLDLNNNLELITVYCFDNLMTRINVDGLTALTTLNSSGNLLTELDMSGCGALRTLNCGGNDLTALELDGCGSLSTLGCSQNALTELDLSACTGLRRLNCTYNRLTSINLSGYSTLTSLSCFNNELTELQVRGCAALKALNCSSNALIELDLNGCDTLLMLVESVEPDIGWSVTYGSGNLMLSYDFGVTLLNSLPDPDFILPASLTTIEPEAFAGGVFVYVVVPEQVTAIGSRAFADCPNLRYVEIQGPATEIAEDAFENVSGLTILDRSGLPAAD